MFSSIGNSNWNIYLLGKYAIEEGQRVERQKEFEKNLENWDKNGRKEKR